MTNYISETFEFSADPGVLLQQFSGEAFCYLLDSSLRDPRRGRYSFFGCDPFEVYRHKARADLDDLRTAFERYRFSGDNGAVFPAGIVGYLAYDHGLYQERIRLCSRDDLDLPDCLFAFYDVGAVIDHQDGTATVYSTGYPETEPQRRARRAKERLTWMRDRLAGAARCISPELPLSPLPAADGLPWPGNFTRADYERAVAQALEYIAAGDIYQVNLSQRFSLDHGGEARPRELYRLLRRYSPSHFGAYFDAGAFQILSSSPERYLQMRGREVLTQPMKGTRPRGADRHEDRRLREEIICSGKDQSELLMITDLERNDLGRVCEFGSVRVLQQRVIEEYATVFQAVSTVAGTVREDVDGFDVLRACFPGGSITGCPKIRAMQIIEELEPTRRSVYTGALGYLSYNGNMDFNILIRTILADSQRYHVQVGGGIVAESTPAAEYAETMVKARAMRDCLAALRAAPATEGGR